MREKAQMGGGAAHLPYRSMREFTGHTDRQREQGQSSSNKLSIVYAYGAPDQSR